jgi:fibronectin-binding autotransporter adhesin
LTAGGNNTSTAYAGSIGGTGGLTKTGSGTLTLSGANTYTGATTVNAGTLQAGSGSAFGVNSAVTLANVAGAALDLNGLNVSIGSLAGGGTTGGNVLLGAGTLTAGGNNTSTTYAGSIGGTGSFIKTGLGAFSLSGANAYTGATTVNAGTLLVNGNQSGAAGLTSVASGATLGGAGMIGGNVNVADGGILAPGNPLGTLTIAGDLTLSNGSILQYEFGQAGVPGGGLNDLTTVGGNLALDGTINVSVPAGGSFGPGVYRAFSYGGALTDNGLTLGTLPTGSEIFVQTAVAGQVNLVNTAGLALNFWDGDAGPKNNNSIDGGDGTWQVGGNNNNWTGSDGAVNADYQPASFAIFGGARGAVTIANTGGAVTASGLQFTTDGYVLGGDTLTLIGSQSVVRVGDGSAADASLVTTIAASLTGATQLVKTDGGTLVLTGVNSYTGGTAINGGTLQISSDANLGAAAGGLSFNGGTLHATGAITSDRAVDLAGSGTFQADAALALNGAVAGAGSLTKTGAGTLTLSGANTYTGATTVNAGTLQAGSGSAFGVNSAVTLADAAGAALDLNGFNVSIGSLAGGGTTGGNVLLGAGTLTAGGNNTSTAYAGSIGGTGGLTKTGSGILTLSGANTYSGGTTISGGTLQISSDANLGAAAGGLRLDGGALHTTGAFTSDRAVEFAGAGTIITDTMLTLNGPFSGPGTLTSGGTGTLVLGGDKSAFAGTILVNNTLVVSGRLCGELSIGNGGRLQGTGTVCSLRNAGTVAPGNSIGTLTVSGPYVGAGGILEIETELGGDASPTDQLVIGGGTSGTTNVLVINDGGTGAATVEGIKIVDVTGGTSSGIFDLLGDYSIAGRPVVVAGAYSYQLVQGGVSTPSDGDWYLRSTQFQPGVPLYESYSGTLQTLNGLPTLEERVGNRQWSGFTNSGVGMWGRVRGTRHRPEADKSSSGADLNIDSWEIQTGFDAALIDDASEVLIAGINGRYGSADARIHSQFGDGDIDTDVFGMGATVTWYSPSGLYVDAQAEFNWYDSHLDSDLLGSLVRGNDGSGEAFSVEVGKRVPVGGSLSVTPQAQIVYSNVRFDRFTDSLGAVVAADDGDSLRARLGLSLDHQASHERDGKTSRMHIYGIANLAYEMLDGTRVDVSGVPLIHRDDRWWGELGVGGSFSWADGRFTIFSEVSGDTSLSNFFDSYSLSANAGFRMRF